ncbi:MAG TPA: murein hydrolase regulator LrgA [Lachnospiraceae bacterium]|nr:murein hydrolase regulator LrgA [Lachnospiraceae bacterium]
MKYLKQFFIIIAISFIGEVMKEIMPFPVPASIYGMLIMLAALGTGIIKLSQVSDTGDFLIEIMPVMFIPAAAGLLDSWKVLKPVLVPVSVITVVSTVIVMAVSGKVTQFAVRHGKREKDS